MTGEVLALGLTVLVHVIGASALILAIFRNGDTDARDWWPGDDNRPPDADPPRPPDPRPSGGGMPLPDADPSGVRLREPARLGDGYPKPARRPEHPPERTPAREPAAR